MERRRIASWRRKETLLSAPLGKIPSAPPPPPDPPPSSSAISRPQKRSTHGLQRDYRVLEREKKVTTVLENNGFRAELENILQGQLEGKMRPPPITRPSPDQWLADLHHSALNKGTRQSVTGHREFVMPINDLSGVLASKYTIAERAMRCKLAAVYRLVDIFGWSQLIYNHITACAPVGSENGYYINAFGLMYAEVTASNLVHVRLEGSIIDPGTTQLGVSGPGIHLHSAVHKSRTDIKCAIHLHNTAIVAISVVSCGLLPISTEANAVGNVCYCDLWDAEREEMEAEIASTLGTAGKVLVLRNHGVVVMGESVEDAFNVACNLVKACEIQVAAMSAGIANLNTNQQGVWSKCKDSGMVQAPEGLKWKPGELQFEALMRMLDSKGYKTGYAYKGLNLLQPGKAEESLRTQEGSLNILGEKETQESETLVAESTNSHPDQPKKEPWEFMVVEDRKIPSPALKLKSAKTRAYRDTDNLAAELTPSDTPRESGAKEGEGLGSLKIVARQVAKSTGDAAQKIVQKREDLSSLKLTAERVARSTGNALQKLAHTQEETISSSEEGEHHMTAKLISKSMPDTLQRASGTIERWELLDMVQQTAEQVERSTSSAVKKINEKKEELDPLEVTKLTAKQVAQSTSEAVKRLEPDNNVDNLPAVFINGDSNSHTSVDPSSPDPLALRHSSRFAFAELAAAPANQGTQFRTSNGTHQFAQMHPATTNNDIARTLPSPPPSAAWELADIIGNNLRLLPTNDRMLPSLPTMLQPHSSTAGTLPNTLQPPPQNSFGEDTTRTVSRSVSGSNKTIQSLPMKPVHKRTLPSIELGKKQTFIPPLTNGYLHGTASLKLDFEEGTHNGSWTRSVESDSEYSTTESVELRVAGTNTELKTNPMKRMSHTAEMVAESTGKAVHKLTSTLS